MRQKNQQQILLIEGPRNWAVIGTTLNDEMYEVKQHGPMKAHDSQPLSGNTPYPFDDNLWVSGEALVYETEPSGFGAFFSIVLAMPALGLLFDVWLF